MDLGKNLRSLVRALATTTLARLDRCDECPAGLGAAAGGVFHHGHLVVPMLADFSFDPLEPLAVEMDLTLYLETTTGRVSAGPASWKFALDLLDTALSRSDQGAVGQGDVIVTYLGERDVLAFTLNTGQEICRVEIDAAPVGDFMAAVAAITPLGGGIEDCPAVGDAVDAAIERLLSGSEG